MLLWVGNGCFPFLVMVNIAGTQLFCGRMKSLLLGLYLLGEVLGHMGECLVVETVHQFCTAVEPIFIPIGGMWLSVRRGQDWGISDHFRFHFSQENRGRDQ